MCSARDIRAKGVEICPKSIEGRQKCQVLWELKPVFSCLIRCFSRKLPRLHVQKGRAKLTMTISLRNLAFTWNPSSSKRLLEIETFQLKKGEKVLVRGQSGSGKSTLLNLIGGLLLPQAGQIQVLDTEINSLPASARDQFRSDHMGFIFQIFNLIPYLNVLENVLLPLSFSKHKRAKLKDPHAEARRLLKALGLENLETQSVQKLSVGQQQRVAVARALIGSPEIVIADEPSSALDAETRKEFLNLLFQECERSGSSLLYVSHDPGLDSLFDRSVPIQSLSKQGAQA